MRLAEDVAWDANDHSLNHTQINTLLYVNFKSVQYKQRIGIISEKKKSLIYTKTIGELIVTC